MNKKLIQKIKRKVKMGDIIFDFKEFKLKVELSDGGGRQYDSRKSYEEINNLFYEDIASILNPDVVVDIGANYGFTALIFKSKFPDAKLILVEPSPKLCKYIYFNMEQNEVDDYQLLSAVCGAIDSKETFFALNPINSQDNRVLGKNSWKKIKVSSITLSEILKKESSENSFFIKIDTQGFETQVFKGGYDFLESHQKWLIKSEFAPSWLKSQGNEAKQLLAELVKKFYVVEVPARTRFGRDKLKELFLKPIHIDEIDAFVNYVESLNKNRLGWVDLYVAPKSLILGSSELIV